MKRFGPYPHPLPPITESVAARFWAGIERGSEAECWPWRRHCDTGGYGVIGIGGRLIKAHRVAYAIAYGHTPGDMCVLHRCDNPCCCNPAHLTLGTQQDNIADMVGKGRVRTRPRFGEENPGARLTEEQVRAMRAQRAAARTPYYVLARQFGVSTMTVLRACKGESWAHLQGEIA
jgi:hypothetical protein